MSDQTRLRLTETGYVLLVLLPIVILATIVASVIMLGTFDAQYAAHTSHLEG